MHQSETPGLPQLVFFCLELHAIQMKHVLNPEPEHFFFDTFVR